MIDVRVSAAPESPPDDRPPIGAVPPSGAAEPYVRLRPTVHDRPLVQPSVWAEHADTGFPVVHPYVRRYWTPILGPGAVADLLRLATAAVRGRSLPRPLHLGELARVGFVHGTGSHLLVRTHVPAVPRVLRRRLPPALRRELDGPSRIARPQATISLGAQKASA
jgi:hypothetical protein